MALHRWTKNDLVGIAQLGTGAEENCRHDSLGLKTNCNGWLFSEYYHKMVILDALTWWWNLSLIILKCRTLVFLFLKVKVDPSKFFPKVMPSNFQQERVALGTVQFEGGLLPNQYRHLVEERKCSIAFNSYIIAGHSISITQWMLIWKPGRAIS